MKLDVDFDQDGECVFDAWRLRWFAENGGDEFGGLDGFGGETVSAREIRSIDDLCRRMAGDGLLREVREGWYARF